MFFITVGGLMICKNCGKEFEGQFCPECGAKVTELQRCPVCGKEHIVDEKKCVNCGYDYSQQNAENAKQNVQTVNAETHSENTSKVSKAITKACWIVPSVGTLLLGIIMLLSLCSPVMLHEGYDISGIGFKHIFKVNIDYVFTITSAIILIMSVFVIILGIARIINALAKPYENIKSKKSYIIDVIICAAVFVVGIAGAANASNWFGSAGSGYLLCIFIGIFGIALVVLRYIFENKFIDSEVAEAKEKKMKDKGYIKNNADVKINKGIKRGSIVLAGLIVIVFVIGIIVSSIYVNPFSFTSFNFATTRGDIIKQFGLPEGAKEDASSYTYIGGQISAYNYLYKNIEALSQEHLGEGMESESDEDIEESFGGLIKLDAIIEKLEEKSKSSSSKKTTVFFNSDGGEDRSADTISTYICEVSSTKNIEDGKIKRSLKYLQIINAFITQYTTDAKIEYIAKYDDGSFIKNTIDLQLDDRIKSESQLPVETTFSDKLGEYNISIDNLDTRGGDYFIENNTLYILQNIADANFFSMPANISKKDITKIVVGDFVSEINATTLADFTNVEEIVLPDVEINIEKGAFANTAFYNNFANWHNGEVLYIGNHLIEAKPSISGNYTIEDNTKYIQKNAFYNCTGLTGIVIPESVISIGSGAFDGCDNISKAEMPAIAIDFITKENLQEVVINSGDNISIKAFADCTSLTSVTISNSVRSIGGKAFYNCTSLASVVLPDSVTSIGDNAFYKCTSLKDITIPDSITSIENDAFYNCTSLTNMVIPDSVASIGSYAFAHCTGLTSVIIGNSVTSMGSDVFYDCTELADVYYAGDIKGWCNITFINAYSNPMYYADNLYFNGELLQGELIIPDSITSINDCAFINCDSLTSIVIPDGVKSIGWYAFADCTSLTSIVIPDSITSILKDSFYNCNSLTDVYYTGDIVGWCNISFDFDKKNPIHYAKNLYINGKLLQGELVIPDSVNSIRDFAFSNCTGLTSVTISNSVTNIGYNAFSNCTNLTSVTIGNSVTNIGDNAFFNCTSLTSIVIPDSVTSIEWYAFADCTRLTSVVVSDSVTKIDSWAFLNCTSLTIYCEAASQPSGWDSSKWNYSNCPVVWDCNNNDIADDGYQYAVIDGLRYAIKDNAATVARNSASGSVVIKSSIDYKGNTYNVTSIGSEAFADCTSLTSVVVPDSITSIVKDSFYNCISLTIYCQAASQPSGWASNWNYAELPVVWDCNNNNIADDGYQYVVIDGLRYGIKDNFAEVARCNVKGNVVIPSSIEYDTVTYNVTSIRNGAFDDCTGLISIVIPVSVTSIGRYAFADCTSLTIYCEAASQPSGWDSSWNYYNCPVVWGYNG